MRRLLSIAVVVLAAAVVAARSGMQAPEPEGEKKLIDLKSDLMGPIAPGDSVVFLVGNFAAQHNGAVITCDSAVRYSDMRIEFSTNAINQGASITTFRSVPIIISISAASGLRMNDATELLSPIVYDAPLHDNVISGNVICSSGVNCNALRTASPFLHSTPEKVKSHTAHKG